MTPFKLFKVQLAHKLDEPRWLYVEALSISNAEFRARAHTDRYIEAVEDLGTMFGFLPVSERERDEVEFEAKRLGLNGDGQ